jgi:hypothetical protein
MFLLLPNTSPVITRNASPFTRRIDASGIFGGVVPP